MIGLTDAGADVIGRVVDHSNGVVRVAFRQDPKTLDLVGKAFDAILARTNAAAYEAAA